MYVFHQPVILLMLRAVGARGLPVVLGSRLPALLAFTLAAKGVTYGCARVSWWALEERFLRLKRRFEYRDEQEPPTRIAATG
jgi:peptidoglycan/LPS O-acetylase OafA/YrhL